MNKMIIDELIPSAVKDFITVITPYLMWLTEVLPTGFAIVGGFFGTLHVINKWRLTQREIKKQKDEDNSSAIQ